jgi:hypothetical protein
MAKVSLLMRYFLMLALLAGGAFLSSCGNDDDEVFPVNVTFSAASASINENDPTKTVTVVLEDFAPEAGTITIGVANGANTEDGDYVLSPAATGGQITINIGLGEQSATFSVTPVDNDEVDGDKSIVFTISAATGGVALGGTATYTLTIVDNDEEQPDPYTPLSEVRAMWDVDNDLTFSEDILVKGVVTTTNDNVTSRNFFMQDTSGGIVIRFVSGVTNSFVPGDEVEVNLNGAILGDFNNLVQVGEVPEANVTKLGTTAVPAHAKITIAQLNSGSFQGQLVEIEGVSFPEADGSSTLSGNRSIQDATGSAIMRTESFAPWSGDLTPLGSGTLRGVAGIFQTNNQLVPVTASDIFASAPLGSVTPSVSSLDDFGDVETGTLSAPKMYTVSASGISSDLNLAATEGFLLAASENGAYASTLTIAAASGTITNAEVWVKFAPNTGAPGNINGSISHVATGAPAATVTVSGTELSAATLVAYTSFEEPELVGGDTTLYTDTGDATQDHALSNNAGQPIINFTSTGGEMGYQASYVATRSGEPGLTDGDNVGIYSSNFQFAPADGFTDGNQGYVVSDPDGKFVLTFDAVDLGAFNSAKLFLDIFVNETGYEADDMVRVYVIADGQEIDILNTSGQDIDDLGIEGVWMTKELDLTDKGTVTLVIELDANGGPEEIFIDNIKFIGQ